MTDSARDKDEVTKDKKMTTCLKLIEYTIKWRPKLCRLAIRERWLAITINPFAYQHRHPGLMGSTDYRVFLLLKPILL